jgi:hypothetical protein
MSFRLCRAMLARSCFPRPAHLATEADNEIGAAARQRTRGIGTSVGADLSRSDDVIPLGSSETRHDRPSMYRGAHLERRARTRWAKQMCECALGAAGGMPPKHPLFASVLAHVANQNGFLIGERASVADLYGRRDRFACKFNTAEPQRAAAVADLLEQEINVIVRRLVSAVVTAPSSGSWRRRGRWRRGRPPRAGRPRPCGCARPRASPGRRCAWCRRGRSGPARARRRPARTRP